MFLVVRAIVRRGAVLRAPSGCGRPAAAVAVAAVVAAARGPAGCGGAARLPAGTGSTSPGAPCTSSGSVRWGRKLL